MFIPIDGARRSLDERVLLGKGAVAMRSMVAAGRYLYRPVAMVQRNRIPDRHFPVVTLLLAAQKPYNMHTFLWRYRYER
ncbi:hypothetical protein NXC24_PC00811 (plasmid) [Rhizobium sp. NXC24]|nr:hypothetical protein NXC24_PC00811 [Rhizobium sp. NXC24]